MHNKIIFEKIQNENSIKYYETLDKNNKISTELRSLSNDDQQLLYNITTYTCVGILFLYRMYEMSIGIYKMFK